MSSQRAWALAAMAALSGGGCALIAGYDFGKYGETGGAGGAGGTGGTGGRAVSPGSGGASVSTSASTTGSVGASSSGSTGSTATSSGSGVGPTSSATSSASSGSGGPTVLRGGLLSPEGIAVDTNNVYFTTNHPASGPSGAGYVTKTGATFGTPVTGADGAPAVAVGNPTVYAATWVTVSGVSTGTVFGYGPGNSMAVGQVGDTLLGIAAWGSTVYFTSQGSRAWTIPPGGSPTTFAPSSSVIASGPIAADSSGVYWPNTVGQMMGADLGGAKAIALSATPDSVYAVATDAASVYWTDQSGGVYQVAKAGGGTVATLNKPTATRAFGIAVDPSDSTVYFVLGADVLRVAFPFVQPPSMVAQGLVNPRGLALDGSFVYVAEGGSGTAADGSILKIARQ